MITIKIAAGNRREVIVDPENTVADVLSENNVNTTGATISIDGVVLTQQELDSTLASVGAVDGSILAAVVKADSARTM